MQPQEDQKFWDKTWDSAMASDPDQPGASTWRNDLDRRLVAFLKPFLPSCGKVAELGCGSARLLARIGREVPLDLVAVDNSTSALQLVNQTAQSFGVKIQPVLDDVTRMAFDDATFDLIISGGLLEHFDDPRPILAEMVRILKPGGVVFAVVVPRKLFSLHRPLHRWLGPQVFRSHFGPRQYADWLKQLGCAEVITESKGVYPPLFHHLPVLPRRVIERTFSPLDGTTLADAIGYFFVFAARRAA